MAITKKRLKNTVRNIIFLMKSGLIKHKKMEDLHMMVKKSGKKLAENFAGLMVHEKQRSLAHLGHYEFSCSSRNRHDLYEAFTQYRRSFHATEIEDSDDSLKDMNNSVCGEEENIEENDVDRKAEEFIARFHEQLKLQRQRSLSKYQEMISRGAY
ncbi:hypothetical protein SUGI_1082320 [Cryptomeria japonica]|uniref:uncharacterized protein LOC131859169 n=1 Tax=Cryptomeria japonica TaxID=3369 RepID=UPI002414C6C8|nr:uncharacterized protein LOC131859169 [Cryptomeria japonica]GLJ50818.1 hypothetical protein SUGI_1082320 [Cryptomeria japonica]